MDMDLFQPDEMHPQGGERTLTCSCPKCSAQIELNLTQVFDATTTETCPACKAHYVLTRESFARRASRKSGEINCALCGAQLDHSQFCPSCKALYPDYFAAEFANAAKKRVHQNRDLFGSLRNFSFEWRHSENVSSVDYKPILMDSEPWKEPARWKNKIIIKYITAISVVILIVAGVSFYSHLRMKKEYAASYIMVLYGIKTGTDLGLKLSSKISSDWSIKGGLSQNVPPIITVDDENQLNSIKAQTDKYFQKLKNPPTTYMESNERLLKLNGLFLKLYTLVLKPSGTPTSFVDQTQKAEKEFKMAATELKKILPKELSTELDIAKTKYRGLSDL